MARMRILKIECEYAEVLEAWKKEAHLTRLDEHTIFHQEGDVLYILTNRPGLFIGYHGNLANKYREILKEYGVNQTEFVDSSYGNIIIF